MVSDRQSPVVLIESSETPPKAAAVAPPTRPLLPVNLPSLEASAEEAMRLNSRPSMPGGMGLPLESTKRGEFSSTGSASLGEHSVLREATRSVEIVRSAQARQKEALEGPHSMKCQGSARMILSHLRALKRMSIPKWPTRRSEREILGSSPGRSINLQARAVMTAAKRTTSRSLHHAEKDSATGKGSTSGIFLGTLWAATTKEWSISGGTSSKSLWMRRMA